MATTKRKAGGVQAQEKEPRGTKTGSASATATAEAKAVPPRSAKGSGAAGTAERPDGSSMGATAGKKRAAPAKGAKGAKVPQGSGAAAGSVAVPEVKSPGRKKSPRSAPKEDSAPKRGASAGTKAGRAARSGLDLQAEARRFVSAHPEGWGHGEWSAYVRSLRERGYPVDDPDRVGDLLERERLRQRLRAVRGLGPQKVEILVERFGAMWRIQEASAEEFQGAGLGPALAGRVRATL